MQLDLILLKRFLSLDVSINSSGLEGVQPDLVLVDSSGFVWFPLIQVDWRECNRRYLGSPQCLRRVSINLSGLEGVQQADTYAAMLGMRSVSINSSGLEGVQPIMLICSMSRHGFPLIQVDWRECNCWVLKALQGLIFSARMRELVGS